MDSGLQKLIEAQQSVAELKEVLAEKEKELAVANREAEEVLKTVRPINNIDNDFDENGSCFRLQFNKTQPRK